VLHRRTPVVFVGNNEYDPERREIGTRQCLNAGRLCVFVAHATRPAGLVRLAVRALAGRLRASVDFDRLSTDEVKIDCAHRDLSVSKDGEVLRLSPPLLYRIRRGALRVIVPRTDPVAQ
jgi:diacylglycerol kinase family enzyme